MAKKGKIKHSNKIFFAYQSKEKSKDSTNVDAIKAFAKDRNDVKIWENMKTNGKFLNRTILDAIDNAEIFACDLSYINFNVLFELGYAIGLRKTLLVLLNTSIKNANTNFQSLTALKSIGYDGFKNSDDIKNALESIDGKTVLLEQFKNLIDSEKDTCDVFYVQSSSSQADLNALEY